MTPRVRAFVEAFVEAFVLSVIVGLGLCLVYWTYIR